MPSHFFWKRAAQRGGMEARVERNVLECLRWGRSWHVATVAWAACYWLVGGVMMDKKFSTHRQR
jgi:hypothetical protein